MSPAETHRHAFNGQLFTTDGKSLRVSISHTEEAILVTVVGDPGDLYERSLTNLTLESTGGRGVLRTRGTGQRVDANLIRFFLEDSADVVQRRQYVRVVAAQRVVLHNEEGDQVMDTLAVNLSGGGMLIAMPRGPAAVADEKLGFVLYLRNDEEPVTGIARVIRVNEADEQLAVTFDEISRRDRERVIRFVFDRQRVALAMTRGDAG